MQILPIGEKVNTEYGVFEIIDYDNVEYNYLCYQQGFDGHSGIGCFGKKYLNTKYEGSCWWFDANEVSLIEEKKDYRKMKPTDLIDIVLDGKEFKVPLGDLVHAKAILGITNGLYGFDLWQAFYQLFQGEISIGKNYSPIEFVDKQRQIIEHFFKPHFDDKEKKELEAQIEAKSNELFELQAKLKDLQS